ncbi:MAG: methyltransferase domain-containing protein [Anaerolineae bacterium]|nr:methyltransferase domain-containing protein [Anaerolineae bacterium]
MKRQFWIGLVAGLALASVLRQTRATALTQSRLDDYYRRRARGYNDTDTQVNLLGRYPRLEMREAVMRLAALKPGDKVLDFACGAGANFPYIMERIGPTGQLVAVDYSADMLAEARKVIDAHGWMNVELIQSDAATMQPGTDFDVALCTLGLVVIPRHEQAMQQAWDALKTGGTYAIADISESEEWYARPIGWLMSFLDFVIITDTTRRPWEWLAARCPDFRRESLFFGYFYAAAGHKPA